MYYNTSAVSRSSGYLIKTNSDDYSLLSGRNYRLSDKDENTTDRRKKPFYMLIYDYPGNSKTDAIKPLKASYFDMIKTKTNGTIIRSARNTYIYNIFQNRHKKPIFAMSR